MPDYTISFISPSDKRSQDQITALLSEEGIRRDTHLDYTCGIFDEAMNIIATGSCFGNTLRCMAVSASHQREGLLNDIVSHLMEIQFARGNTHLFLYTKCDSAKFFGDLGFHEILRIEGQIAFMENRRGGFQKYLARLSGQKADGTRIAALVMNANPFTLGHQFLVEKAASENDILHLFIVSEDASLVPFEVRKRLVLEGTSHLENIIYHDSGPYIISNATFPSYFQKDGTAVIESHALLDLMIFTKIAEALGITTRYVGDEPTSLVTGIYNRIMKEKLPEHGVECVVVSRRSLGKAAISASTARQAIKAGDFDLLRELVPKSTLRYFLSAEAEPVIRKIQAASDVVHY